MNVQFVTPFLDSFGGVQASARLALDGLRDDQRVGHFELLQYRSGVQITNSLGKLSFLLSAARRSQKFDVIVVWHLGLAKTLPILRSGSARVVIFLHGIEAWKPLDWMTLRVLRNIHCFLHNSEHTWNRFVVANPQFQAFPHQLLPLGIGSAVDRPVSAPSNIPVAVMLGRMDAREDYKGHREVIEAWPLVRAAVPDAQLWIVGNGDLIPSLRNVARRVNMDGCITFVGAVTEEEKEELLIQSRCLALPSRGEGFGLVYLEAMRLGRPCLVSQSDAGSEVIAAPQAGLAVDVDEAGSIAEGLIRLLRNDRAWQIQSNNARRRYEAQFTAVHFQRRVMDALVAQVAEPATAVFA